jgi:hypothetical protein
MITAPRASHANRLEDPWPATRLRKHSRAAAKIFSSGCVIPLLALVAVPLRAAEGPHLELSASGGVSLFRAESLPYLDGSTPPPHLTPDVTTLGGSGVFGLSAAHVFAPGSTVEAAVSVAPLHSLKTDWYCTVPGACEVAHKTTRRRLVAYHFDAWLRRRIDRGPVSPFVAAGLGRVQYGGGHEGTWALLLAAGIETKLSNRSRLRIELADSVLRDHFLLPSDAVPDHNTKHEPQVKIAVVLRP